MNVFIGQKLENWMIDVPTLDVNKILKRIHLQWEAICDQNSMTYEQMIHFGRDGLSEKSLYSRLDTVLSYYSENLITLILKDNHFDK